MEKIGITAVSNGYIVDSLPDNYRDGMATARGDTYVFESMESLTEWIKENMENK